MLIGHGHRDVLPGNRDKPPRDCSDNDDSIASHGGPRGLGSLLAERDQTTHPAPRCFATTGLSTGTAIRSCHANRSRLRCTARSRTNRSVSTAFSVTVHRRVPSLLRMKQRFDRHTKTEPAPRASTSRDETVRCPALARSTIMRGGRSLTTRSHAVGGSDNGSGWKQSSPPGSFRCRGSPGRQGSPVRCARPEAQPSVLDSYPALTNQRNKVTGRGRR